MSTAYCLNQTGSRIANTMTNEMGSRQNNDKHLANNTQGSFDKSRMNQASGFYTINPMSSGVLSTQQNEGRKMVNLRAGSAAYRLLRKPKNYMTRENL